MISAMAQAAAEAAKNPGIFTGAGRVLVDGTIIVALLKLAEALIGKWQRRQGGSKAPQPKPGETETCKDHMAQIKELRGVVQSHGEQLSGLKEFKGNTAESLKRIEAKVDDLKDVIIGRERA